MNYSLNGVINTKTDNWEDDFLTWIESRKEGFAGSIVELESNDYDEMLEEHQLELDKFFEELDSKQSTDDRI
jgi:hypothetical protein